MNERMNCGPQSRAKIFSFIVYHLNSCAPDSSAGNIDYSQKVDVIVVVRNYTQVADYILDFLALKKACSATHGVRNVVFQKCFFNKTALSICANQNTEFIVFAAVFHGNALNAFCNKRCFFRLILGHKNFNRLSFAFTRP